MRLPRIPRDVHEMAERLSSAGRQAWIVGGAVRDAALGIPVSDYDMATDATPEESMKLFRRVIPTGIRHGTVTVLLREHKVELTTFRIEHGYSDGRHPDAVEFASDIEADLARRDFTMNAMAWNPLTGSLADPFGGRADLAARLVRAVGDAAARFDEDGLRPLRAIRFACRFGFDLEGSTLAAIPGALERLRGVSAERIRDELSKILLSARPSIGFILMERTGILPVVIPELPAGRGVAQRGAHRLDVLDHLYATVDAAPPDLGLRLAALLHDIGKPSACLEGEGGIPTFHRHEETGAEMAGTILRRLRFPNELVGRVVHLVRHHMFNYEDGWTDAAVRRFVARVGKDSIPDLFALRMADGTGTTGTRPDPSALAGFGKRIDGVLERGAALGISDLAIGGEELAALGVPRGPMMGAILKELLETVMDDPGQNEKSRLLRIAAALKERRGT